MLHALFTCLWIPNSSLAVFTCLRQRLGLSIPKARCPPRFFEIFKKKTDNYVETDRTSERFFDGNSISRK
jgi:hypothetical protein